MKNLRNLKLPKVEKVILARAPKDGEGNIRASDRRFRIKTSGEKLREEIRRSTPKVTWEVEVNKLNCSTKEITKYPCCNQLISGKPGGAFLECCNKIEGINSPLPEHCMGLDIEKFIVQLQLCI